jgi:hypothetical protein
VLGGAIEPELSSDRGIVSLNGAAERMTEAVALAKRYPMARIVFTGANAEVGLIQDFLGQASIANTIRYTRLVASQHART